MKKKAVLGPLKYKSSVNFTVETRIHEDVKNMLETRRVKLQHVLAEFTRRLALGDPAATCFIDSAKARLLESKPKSALSFEFSNEIDVEAMYNLIQSDENT